MYCFFIVTLLCGLFGFLITSYFSSTMLYIKIIGATYLIWLAALSILIQTKPDQSTGQTPRHHLFFRGCLLQIINIKVIVFSLNLMTNFILPNFNSFESIAVFWLLISVVVLAANSVWSLAGSALKIFIENFSLAFNIIIAGLLVYSAICIF
ncbi:MAG TPA: hypothetical protein DCP90_06380 [Clostridiales bacterium]|nr:MAG: hypothetical protein A2Y22_00895 [Clostridiales bacterium GWD2_32_59]HAN10222.1 hypothetical protein [Clostridiales bacterium]